MTTEIGLSKPKAIDFTFGGEKLAVRKLPVSLGLKLQALGDDEEVPRDLFAEIIATCVVSESGDPVFNAAQVLGLDLEPMLKLFNEISGMTVNADGAEKN